MLHTMLRTARRRIGDLCRRLRTGLIERRPLGPGFDDHRFRLQLESVDPDGSVRFTTPTTAFRWIAAALGVVGADRQRARLWERAVRADPRDDERWVGLACALRTTGAPGPVMTTVTGLTLYPTVAIESASYAFDEAIRLGPLAPALCGAAEVARDAENLQRALELSRRATELYPRDARAWMVRARSLAADAQRVGGLTPDDVESIRDSWQRALDLGGPTAGGARLHLLRHLIRFGDWDRAFTVADPRAIRVPRDTDEIVALIDDSGFTPSAGWWYTAWWRLQASARTRDGWSARCREAETHLAAHSSPFAPFDRLQIAVQSLIVLGRPHEALRMLDRARRLPDARGRLARLRADVLLRSGDPSELVSWSAGHATGLAPGPERWFAEMVGGQRIAVVGPHATTSERARADEEHDLVIDTKQLGASGRSSQSAHVSYYADTSAALFAESIVEQLEGGCLDGAVLRPSALGIDLAGHPRVRVAPTEDSLCLGVSHFGIGRIVYDVLRYAPRTITLVGVDFFTSTTEYPDDYLRDKDRYAHSGFASVLARFNHDVADDFVMLSNLRTTGLVAADASTAAVLSLPFDEYLAAVDVASTGMVDA